MYFAFWVYQKKDLAQEIYNQRRLVGAQSDIILIFSFALLLTRSQF